MKVPALFIEYGLMGDREIYYCGRKGMQRDEYSIIMNNYAGYFWAGILPRVANRLIFKGL